MSFHKKKNVSMSYYLIAKTTMTLDKIKCKTCNNYLKTVVSSSLYYYWTELMLQCKRFREWTTVHKKFNPYTLLYDGFTISESCCTRIGNKHSSIFYELVEIYNVMNLQSDTKTSMFFFGPVAENCKNTLLHLTNYSNTNFICYPTVYPNSFYQIVMNMTIIDFIYVSSDETNEYSYALEILKQLCLALCIQNNKGTLVFKINSIFQSLTIDILFLVCSMYEKVYVTKPVCSNLCDFSKYIICKGFIKPKNKEFLISTFQSLYYQLWNNTEYIEKIISVSIPIYFINKIEELNSIFGQPSLEHIYNILVNEGEVKPDRQKYDLTKCHEWCTKYHVQIYHKNTVKF